MGEGCEVKTAENRNDTEKEIAEAESGLMKGVWGGAVQLEWR
jgi:hypothetical protein